MENSYVLQLLDPKFKSLQMHFCGYSQCEPLHSYGPAARPHYLIHFVLSGKGIYQVGEQKYHLSAGQGFLIEPETQTFYQADRKDPWTYIWIGFDGSASAMVLQDIGLNSRQRIFQSSRGEELKALVLDMLKHTDSTTSNFYYQQAKLYEFISVLTQDIRIETYEDTNRESIYVRKAITYIRSHYAQQITVSDIADELCINRSYLYTIFMNRLSMSPKDFLTKFRISRAKEQLALSDDTIETIALSCGYASALSFSRAFKQEVGITPTEHRLGNRDENRRHLLASREELSGLSDENRSDGQIRLARQR